MLFLLLNKMFLGVVTKKNPRYLLGFFFFAKSLLAFYVRRRNLFMTKANRTSVVTIPIAQIAQTASEIYI